MKQFYFNMPDVVMLLFISLPRWPNTNTFCKVNMPNIVPLSNIGEMIKQKKMRMVWV
jgi:hypothetical protein